MFVLLAIEYEQASGANTFRRFVARRVDALWRETERTTASCSLDFLASWLHPDEDDLCVWDFEQKAVLEAAWKKQFGTALPYTVVTTDHKTYRAVGGIVKPGASLYKVATARGIIKSTFPGGVNNEMSVFNRLMAVLGLSQKKLRRESTPPEGTATLQERNQAIILKTRYKYLFAKDSIVFHTKDCPCARNVKNLSGSERYNVAANGRRPCLRCKPIPPIKIPQQQSDKEAKRKAKELAEYNLERIQVALITGELVYLERKAVLGNCWCELHPGKLTKKLIAEHGCIAKECHFFQKYEERPYWIAKEQEKAARQKKKAKAKRTQKLRDEEAAQLEKTRLTFQAHAELTEEGMDVIKVDRLGSDLFRVFYVSDFGFADGNRFPKTLKGFHALYPSYRIELRHIKDVDGHFVTREEFYTRRRA